MSTKRDTSAFTNEMIDFIDDSLVQLDELSLSESDTHALLESLASLKSAFQVDDLDAVFKVVLNLRKTLSSTEPDSKRPSRKNLFEQALLTYAELSEGYLLDSDNPINLFKTKKGRRNRIETLKGELKGASKATLEEIVIELALNFELLSEQKKIAINTVSFLHDHFLGRYETETTVAVKASKGKQRVFARNEDCLAQAKIALERDLKRPLREDDFEEFQLIVFRYFPRPPFIPRARLTAAERRLPPSVQQRLRDEKARTGWAKSTLNTWWKRNWQKNNE